MGLDSSMRSMIARAVGARRIPYANHVLAQSFMLTSALALVMIAAGIFLAEPLLRLIGMSDAAVEQGTGYMRVQLIAMACLSYHRLFAGALQASGDSITPLKAAVVSRVIHIALSPIFIFGWLGMPALGLTGAAFARLAAEVFGVGMTYWALRSGRARIGLSFREFRIDLPLIRNLIRQGAPASVTNMQRGVSQLVVVGVAAQFGDVALAAFALARRAENVINQSSRGMGRAAGALAGQNLGADLTDRARSAVRWGMLIGFGMAAPTLVLLIAFPEPIAGFFNSDADFIAISSTWLVIATIGYIFMCPVQIFTQGVQHIRLHIRADGHHRGDHVGTRDSTHIYTGELQPAGASRHSRSNRRRNGAQASSIHVVLLPWELATHRPALICLHVGYSCKPTTPYAILFYTSRSESTRLDLADCQQWKNAPH